MSMTNYVIVVILVVILNLREKEIRPSRLWITPVLFAYLMLSNVTTIDLTPGSLLIYLVCIVLGLALGAWRGKLQKVRVNPDTGKITSQGSVAGIVIFLAVMLIRHLAEYWGAHHAVVAISTGLLFVSLANVFARRYFVYLKYKQLAGYSGR
ncbi:hypothetical protein ACFRAM_04760 [Paenibacillus sp. NPDC056722]|uniref:hypothetical protein n=1 Tax=Paenibacillus sp. NPDC056722 TaxID=3345924 RepID=UPI0036AC7725